MPGSAAALRQERLKKPGVRPNTPVLFTINEEDEHQKSNHSKRSKGMHYFSQASLGYLQTTSSIAMAEYRMLLFSVLSFFLHWVTILKVGLWLLNCCKLLLVLIFITLISNLLDMQLVKRNAVKRAMKFVSMQE